MIAKLAEIEAKIPQNFWNTFLHSLIDSALREISSKQPRQQLQSRQQQRRQHQLSTTSSDEDVDLTSWNLDVDEWLQLRDDVVQMLQRMRKKRVLKDDASSFKNVVDDLVCATKQPSTESQSLTSFDSQDVPLTSRLIRRLWKCLEIRSSELESALSLLNSSLLISTRKRRLINFDWTLNFVLSSDKCVRVDEPRTMLHLGTVGGRGEKAKRNDLVKKRPEYRSLDLSLGDIRLLMTTLKHVLTSIDDAAIPKPSR